MDLFQEDDLGGNSLKAQASRSRAAALGTPIRLNRDLLSGKDLYRQHSPVELSRDYHVCYVTLCSPVRHPLKGCELVLFNEASLTLSSSLRLQPGEPCSVITSC